MEETFLMWFTLLAQIFAMVAMHWILAPPKTWTGVTEEELAAELEEWTDSDDSSVSDQ